MFLLQESIPLEKCLIGLHSPFNYLGRFHECSSQSKNIGVQGHGWITQFVMMCFGCAHGNRCVGLQVFHRFQLVGC